MSCHSERAAANRGIAVRPVERVVIRRCARNDYGSRGGYSTTLTLGGKDFATYPIALSNAGSLRVFSGDQIASLLSEVGVTHVITVPDSTIGRWEPAIERTGRSRLVRVCREGEAWQVAAGLHFGGATPLVMIQCTGLFESGDAIRNALHDWKVPVFSIVGYRSYLDQAKLPGDTCLVFTEPILDAWKIDYRLITSPSELHVIRDHFLICRDAGKPGAALIGE